MFSSPPKGMSQKALDQALCFAVDHADHQSVPWLVAGGANPNQCVNSDRTLLHQACSSGWSEVAMALVRAGASTSAFSNGFTPLHNAWSSGKSDLALALMQSGHVDLQLRNHDGLNYLHWAVCTKNVDAARAFIEHGLPVDAVCVSGETALMLCAKKERNECVELLLEKGANPELTDAKGRTALHLAAGADRTSPSCYTITRRLIAGRANLDAADLQGHTPLHLACYLQNYGSTHLLLAAGAAHKKSNDHTTPMDLLVTSPMRSMSKNGASDHRSHCLLMAAHGADTSTLGKDLAGIAPLKAAALMGLTERAVQLAQSGSPVRLSPRHQSLATVAMQAGHAETASVLQAEEARQAIEGVLDSSLRMAPKRADLG